LKMKLTLNRKITIGIAVGLILGLLLAFDVVPSTIAGVNVVDIFRFVGKIFMRMLKVIVVPLVFFSIFVGVTSVGDATRLGKLGLRTIVYYMCTTLIAVIIGLILVNIIGPGVGFAPGEAAPSAPLEAMKGMSVIGLLEQQVLSFIKNPFEALASGTSSLIAIILASIAFAVAIIAIRNPKKTVVVNFMGTLNDAVFWVTKQILRLAPYGVCGILVAVLFDKREQLVDLVKGLTLFAVTSYLGLLIHGLIVLPIILKIFSRRSVREFFGGISEALEVAFATDSSVATIPVTLTNLQDNLKVSKRTSDFVIPIGATINMDGTALYEAVCALFIAQALNIDLTLFQQVIIFFTATVASIGAAGIPSAGLVTLVIVINAVGLPYEQSAPLIGIIFAIDRFIDVIRTMVNVEGDCVGCVIIDEMSEKNP